MHDIIHIDAGTHEVVVSHNLASALKDVFIKEEVPSGPFLVLVDENTHHHCYSRLFELQGVSYHPLVVAAGETSKKLATVERVAQMMLDHKASRQTLLVNLGGGVVTDLGGMVASMYMRGVRYINVPTSLLAMTDAAIGGKTGVDLNGYKNLLGAFYPPVQTIVNTGFLETLPQKDWNEGLVETWKHALIGDPTLWQQIINEPQLFAFGPRSSHKNLSWITKSISVKAHIVKQDPLEMGVRKHLNFGHTVAHALEAWSFNHGDKSITHGQAVAIGLVCESFVSQKVLGLDVRVVEDLKMLFKSHFHLSKINPEYFTFLLAAMRKDKKSDGHDLSCVLLERIGSPRFCNNLPDDLFLESFIYFNDF